MKARVRRPVRARWFWATAIVLLWSAGPVLGAWHAAVEPHRFCATHGVFEDVAPAARDAHAHRGPVSVEPAPARDAAARHDPCAFAPGAHATRSPAVSAAVAQRAPAGAPVAIPVARTIAPPIDLLAVAPKGSPPVASV